MSCHLQKALRINTPPGQLNSSAIVNIRAKGGGAKRTEKQNLARMARRKPFFETLRKLFLRGQLREILGTSKGLNKRNGIGGGQNVSRLGDRKLFSVGGLLVRFAPPPSFCRPPWLPLDFQHLHDTCLNFPLACLLQIKKAKCWKDNRSPINVFSAELFCMYLLQPASEHPNLRRTLKSTSIIGLVGISAPKKKN